MSFGDEILDYKVTKVENKSPNVVLSKEKSHSDMALKTSTVVPKINLEKNKEQTDLVETLHEKKNQSNGSVINVESQNMEESSLLSTVVEDPISSDVSKLADKLVDKEKGFVARRLNFVLGDAFL